MALSTRGMKAEDWEAVKPLFAPHEFRAPKRMGYEFMLWLYRVRMTAGVKMVISSSTRNRQRNTAVGGATDSAHLDELCEAVDVVPENNHARFEIIKAALDLGCTRIGFYKNGSLHIDRTEGRRPARRFWNVSK